MKVVPTGEGTDVSEPVDDPEAVSFSSLFRFASGLDIIIVGIGIFIQLVVGCGFAAMNLVFGEMLDDIASPSGSVTETIMPTVYIMGVLAVAFGLLAFLGSSSIPYVAARIANNVRLEYLKAIVRQDMAFFDTAKPGAIVASITSDSMDLEEGISVKLGEGLQACAGVVSGLAVAFYFSWQVTLICCLALPVMVGGFILIKSSGVGKDGVTGKSAFDRASNIATETLSAMRTVTAMGAETRAAERFESNLEVAEKAAIKEGNIVGLGTGMLWGGFFAMMGIGFWYGGVLIVNSSRSALKKNPIPISFRGPFVLNETTGFPDPSAAYASNNTYFWSYTMALEICKFRPTGSFGKGDLLDYTGEAFDLCACSIPWDALRDSNADAVEYMSMSGGTLVDPLCGCSINLSGLSVNSECISGGRTVAVFFSVMIGGFLMSQIGPSFKAIGKARIAAARMYRVIDRKPTIDSTSTSGMKVGQKGRGDVGDYTNLSGAIGLRGVHFAYPGAEGKIFNGIDLDIAAGETVAIVGESGSGKSTIARLVSRFYDPQEGTVSLDGHDVKSLDLVSMRNSIGIVSQEPLLFDSSIMDNIKQGKPGGAEEHEVIAAAKAANAHDFITAFPDGYNTRVGARGSKLSGGQKQRVAIARALVRKPRILVLDEATSALDNESERIVQAAIDKLVTSTTKDQGSRMTTIIIAHRLSTVRNADRIVVLGSKEGTSTAQGSSIVEIGTHAALMQKPKGLYRALVGGAESEASSGDKGAVLARRSSDGVDVKWAASSSTMRNNAEERSASAVATKSAEGSQSLPEDEIVGTSAIILTEDEQKKAEAALLEKEFSELDKKKLWEYTAPERLHFILGLFCCFGNGCVWPGSGIIFALLLGSFQLKDLDRAKSDIESCAVLFGFLSLFSILMTWTQIYLFEIIGERMTRRLRAAYFRALLRQDIAWFDDPTNSLGVLIARLSVDIKLVRLTVGQGTGASLQSMTSLLVGFVVALVGAWQFALAFVGMVPLLALTEAINWAMLEGSGSMCKKELAKMSGEFGEYIQAIREVQSFSLEDRLISRAKEVLEKKIVNHGKKAAIMRGISAAAVQVIQLGVYALAFYIGGIMLDAELLDYESFNVVMWALGFGASGMGQAANWVAKAQEGKSAANRVFSLFDRVPPIDSRPWESDGSVRSVATKAPRAIEDVKGRVQLEAVRFVYPTRKTARVFDGLSIDIAAGSTAALIGSSGSGKSTIMQLLQRFYDPTAPVVDQGSAGAAAAAAAGAEAEPSREDLAAANGSVLIDGVDIRELDVKFLRGLFGVVGQEPVLFDTSVAENIRYGRPDATMEEVVEAAKVAQAHGFISTFEGGYDYVVGDRGKKVSGGQKQRIAIARAILRQPKVLLLDEATSALDNESEKNVQASLDALMADRTSKRTTVVIAHRLSTIRNADCIYVLENKGDGAIVVESGSHEELLAKEGKYKALLQAYSG